LLTVLDLEYTFEDVIDDRTMSTIGIAYFERSSTAYLQTNIDQAPGVFKIEVENVIVQKQELVTHQKVNNTLQNDPLLRRRLEAQTDLVITVDVVVSVVLNRSEDLKLNNFFEEFFQMPDHKSELRDMVKLEEKVAQELFIKGDVASSNESAKDQPKKKSSKNGAVAGSVLGILALIVGSGLIYMWVQTRRKPNTSGKLENLGTISKSFESEDRAISVPQSLFKREIEYTDSNDHSENSVTESGYRRKSSLTPLMFIPALIPTESNIEVPDTPGTNFAVNGFATPASASGFATPVNASGFMTPSSTRSRGAGSVKLRKLLGDASPDDSVSPVHKPKETPKSIKKIPLPPKLLSPLKSPFRREPKAESQEFDTFSVSRVGVVAGKNNIRPSEKRKKKETEAEMILRDLPMEIGGPSTAPKPTVIPVEDDIVFRPSSGPRPTVIPVEDDLISRKTTSSRKKKKKPPRPWPPPKMESSSNTVVTSASKLRRKKDYSVVDIVDEIAYLYSANDPERYTNSSSEV